MVTRPRRLIRGSGLLRMTTVGSTHSASPYAVQVRPHTTACVRPDATQPVRHATGHWVGVPPLFRVSRAVRASWSVATFDMVRPGTRFRLASAQLSAGTR